MSLRSCEKLQVFILFRLHRSLDAKVLHFRKVMPNILFVDNDESLCIDINGYLTSAGVQNEFALDAENALQMLEKKPFDLAIYDVKLPGSPIRELIAKTRETRPETIVLVHSDLDSVNHAARAVKDGAYSILRKPFNMPELVFQIKRALEHKAQLKNADENAKRFVSKFQPASFIGQSIEIKKIFHIVDRVAQTDSSVIITGETGTGKELIAGSIHYNSKRSNNPFVKVNCAALPENLLESELFGYERGAFTGAERTRIGRFEMADGGTMFLDEIADMSLYTQAKVLRALQEQEFERVGSNKTVKTDVRIIAATNKNLMKMMEDGEFREDLFYRLNVVNINLPPLRERGNDLRLLVQFFVRKYSLLVNRRIRSVHRDAMKLLADYHWPGNIRELENTIERVVLMTEGDVITPDELAENFYRRPKRGELVPLNGSPVPDENFNVCIPADGISLEEVEQKLIVQALTQANWIQKDAAAMLKVTSRVLNYKVKRFGITHESWRQNK